MPAGTDLVTWSPRVGSTGDDRYDPGADIAWTAGSSAGYSSPPTLTEVNAGTGMNQIIAECNRRRWDSATYVTGSVNDFSALSYVTAGTSVATASFIESTLSAAIDKIRNMEGSSVFDFTNDPYSAGNVLKRQDILDLRKALAIDYIAIPAYRADYDATGPYGSLIRSGLTYPPATTTAISTGTVGGHLGQRLSGSTYQQFRRYVFLRLPSGLPTIATAVLEYLYSNQTSVGIGHKIYSANTHLGPLDTGDWGNLDNLEATVADPEATGYLTTTLTTAFNSGNKTFILVSSNDVDSVAPSGNEKDLISTESGGGNGRERLKLYT